MIVAGRRVHTETNFLPHLLPGPGQMGGWKELKGQNELKGQSNSTAMAAS